jgi:Protein of unknown function (DUF3800)
MTSNFYAYVDEAGDEGFGKLRQPGTSGQSKWFALGATLVSEQNDKFIPSWRDEVMSLFPNKQARSDLHFRNLNHNQRVASVKLLSEKQLGICVVASNKETIIDSSKKQIFKEKQHLYNYLVRYLMERLTHACYQKVALDGNRPARLFVTFSRRAGTDYAVMQKYFELMRDGMEVMQSKRSINWQVFNPADIRVENHAVRAGLQIADVVTSASFAALEPNEFGNIEPRYALQLKNRFLKENSAVLDCGLTLIPRINQNPLNAEQLDFIKQLK